MNIQKLRSVKFKRFLKLDDAQNLGIFKGVWRISLPLHLLAGVDCD